MAERFSGASGRGRERPIAAHLRLSGGREHRVRRGTRKRANCAAKYALSFAFIAPSPGGAVEMAERFSGASGRGRERPIAAHLRLSGGREHRVRRAGEPERALLQLRHGRLCGRRSVYTAAYRAISSRPAKPVSSGSRPFRPCPNGMCVSAPDRRLKASGAACRGDRLLQHREHMRGAYRRVCRGDRLLQHREWMCGAYRRVCRGDRLLQHREHMRGAYRRVCRGAGLFQHREHMRGAYRRVCRGAKLLQQREWMCGAYRELSARKAPHCGEI